MPPLGPLCLWSVQMLVRIAGLTDTHLHCTQGVPGAPLRYACPVFMREPGADDDVMPRRLGRWQIVGTA